VRYEGCVLDSAVVAESLSVVIGGNVIFQDVSFVVQRGAVVLLLGANGVGKSTLLRCIAGLTSLRSGRIQASSNIGYVGHESMCYSELTTEENLEFFMELEGIKTPDLMAETLSKWNLQKYRGFQFSELSKGIMNRVSTSRAFWGTRDLILLDEPTASLDDQSTELLKAQIRNFVSKNLEVGSPGSVIVSTHDIARLADIATHSLTLHGGGSLDSYELSDVATGIKRYQEHNR
jgi:ABC-type multidrug transport system ATPase subunit